MPPPSPLVRVALAALAFVVAAPSQAQLALNRERVPSPAAASLGKFEEIPVSLYTGVPDISIPLYTGQGRDLSVPITLRYHSAGARVDESAGIVGLGWALEAGGAVMRTVRGFADEVPSAQFGCQQVQPYQQYEGAVNAAVQHYAANGEFPATTEDSLVGGVWGLNGYTCSNDPAEDTQPDVFTFNVNGRTGRFIIARSDVTSGTIGNGSGRVTLLAASPLRITWTSASNRFTAFEITDENGVIYRLDTRERVEEQYGSWGCSNSQHCTNAPSWSTTPFWSYDTAWYLTTISSPVGAEVVTFAYDFVVDEAKLVGTAYHKYVNWTAPSAARTEQSWGMSRVRSVYSVPLVRTITFPDRETVSFTYTSPSAFKAQHGVRPTNYTLAKVEVKRGTQTTPIKTWTLRYDPFPSGTYSGNPTSGGTLSPSASGAYREARLLEAEESGAPAYIFTYDATALPENFDLTNSYTSSNTAQPANSIWYDYRDNNALDHWGYYNGKSANTTPNYWTTAPRIPGGSYDGITFGGADREPDATGTYQRAGILKKIQYPTGGSTEFVFEPNTYSWTASQDATQPQVTLRANLGSPAKTFTVHGLQAVTVRYNGYCSNQTYPGGTPPTTCNARLVLRRTDGTPGITFSKAIPLAASMPAQVKTQTAYLHPGTYEIAGVQNGSTSSGYIEVVYRTDDPDAATRRSASASFTNRTGGGLRVKKITTTPGIGAAVVREYAYEEAGVAGRSSGVLVSPPVYALGESGPQGGATSYKMYLRESASNIPMGTTNGASVGYREVTEILGAAGADGRVRHVFWSPLEVPDTPVSTPLATPRTSLDALRGQEVLVEESNGSGQLVSRTTRTFQRSLLSDRHHFGIHFRDLRDASVGIDTGDRWLRRAVTFDAVTWVRPTGETLERFLAGASAGTLARSLAYETAPTSPVFTLLRSEAESADGGLYRRTDYRYVAEQYAASATTPASRNVIAPVYSTTVVTTGDNVEAKSWTKWALWTSGTKTYWRPSESWTWNGSGADDDATAPADPTSEAFRTSQVVAYDTYGRPTQVRDARSTLTTLTYGPAANGPYLTASSTAGLTTSIGYDANGLPTSITDPAGNATTYAYDAHGRLTHVRRPETPAGTTAAPTWTTTYAYVYGSPGVANAVHQTDYASASVAAQSTTFTDGLGRPIQSQVKAPIASGAIGRRVAATEYDARGRVWRRWAPYERTGSIAFDTQVSSGANAHYDGTPGPNAAGRPYTETLYLPDPTRRVKETRAEGTTMPVALAYNYDPVDFTTWTEVTDETGRRTRTYTDAFGRTLLTVAGAGVAADEAKTGARYDILNRLRESRAPNYYAPPSGSTAAQWASTYLYDPAGRLLRQTTPDAGTARTVYDHAGNPRFVQDAVDAGSSDEAYTFTTYDALDRPLVTGRRFNSPNSFPDANPNASNSFESSTANWQIVRAYDAAPTWSAFPWSTVDNQQIVGYITQAHLPGRLAAAASKSADGTWQIETYSYDRDGRLAEKYVLTQGLESIGMNYVYAYDWQGRQTYTVRRTADGGKQFHQWYDYDTAGQLTQVRHNTSASRPASAQVTYSYDARGARASYQYAGGPKVPVAYTARGWVASIGDPSTSAYPFSERRSYLANGLVSEVDIYNGGSPHASKRYRYSMAASTAYDALGRLKSADYSNGQVGSSSWASTTAYDVSGVTYDRNGNLTALQRRKETGALVDNLTYAYQTGRNRVASITDAVAATPEAWDAESGAFAYDDNGNATSVAPLGLSLAYDWQNLPRTVTRAGVTSAYRYSAGGQRYWTKTGSSNAEYVALDGTSTVARFTLSSTGSITAWEWTVLAGGAPIGRQPYNNSARYHHIDGIGSVRSVTSGATVVEARDYDPWGLEMPGRVTTSGTKGQEGFTGHDLDAESGLNYAGARYYMPALGRWMSIDPLTALAPDITPYHYVRNRPFSFSDPTGMYEVDCAGLNSVGAGDFAAALVGDGSTGNWCASDREDNTDTWHNANWYNLQNGRSGQYRSIKQRADFYGWFQELSLDAGHETYWAGAAYIVATNLSAVDSFLGDLFANAGLDGAVSAFANEGNQLIFDDVFPSLKNLINGPALTGEDAFDWDGDTLYREQFVIIQPVYERQTAAVIGRLQSMASARGVFYLGSTGMLTFRGDIMNPMDRFAYGMNQAVPYYKLARALYQSYGQLGW